MKEPKFKHGEKVMYLRINSFTTEFNIDVSEISEMTFDGDRWLYKLLRGTQLYTEKTIFTSVKEMGKYALKYTETKLISQRKRIEEDIKELSKKFN